MANNDVLKSVQEMLDSANSQSGTSNVREEFFDDFFLRSIHDIDTQTISISYSGEKKILGIQAVKGAMDAKVITKKEFTILPEVYIEFCNTVLGINPDEKFNAAASTNIEGVTCRVFAITKPYTPYPEIVISTLKEPPKKIDTLNDTQEEILKEIVTSGESFLIAGSSGAGKSYILNYMLDKYYPADQRVVLVEEFDEIIEPSPFTTKLLTPPIKPINKINHLRFLTEEAQLMRSDLMVVGEIKGDETFSFILGAASGTVSVATVHGSSVENALQRVRLLCSLAQPNLEHKSIDQLIAQAVKYIIMVKQGQVVQICKILNSNNGRFSLHTLGVNGDTSI